MPEGVRDSWDQEDTRGVEFGFKSTSAGRRGDGQRVRLLHAHRRRVHVLLRGAVQRADHPEHRRGQVCRLRRRRRPGCRSRGCSSTSRSGCSTPRYWRARGSGPAASTSRASSCRSTRRSTINAGVSYSRSLLERMAGLHATSTTSASVARRSIPRISRCAIPSTC